MVSIYSNMSEALPLSKKKEGYVLQIKFLIAIGIFTTNHRTRKSRHCIRGLPYQLLHERIPQQPVETVNADSAARKRQKRWGHTMCLCTCRRVTKWRFCI